MRIEIWADIMCPWCHIGKRRFARALAEYDRRDEVEVVARSFELRPRQPAVPGPTLGEMMPGLYGVPAGNVPRLFRWIDGLGAELGIEIAMADVRPVSSFDAHRLLHLAARRSRHDELQDRLFHAHLAQHLNVADHGILARLATEAGLDGGEVRAVLSGDAYVEDVRADEHRAAELGVTSVPAYHLEGVGLLSGARSDDDLLGLLRQGASRHA